MNAVFVTQYEKYMEITVNVPEFDSVHEAYTIAQTEKNPIMPFYEYNKERAIATCQICGAKFIKSRNMKTSQSNICRKQLVVNRKIMNK